MSKNFKQRFLDKEFLYSFEEELEQAVEDWHETHIGPETLIEYLGLNIEEYTACLKCSSILEELLIANGNN